ncbi:unnamed protein product [Nesidiocoris tenuis]|uniref:Uncharacterized protein n=1 Tax=Nesidiocoris tenuis TaxID=355587 RepID=A0A6H5GWU7_9HEMI|nr:unnamed protein product [Nesidiocoris tenuis]
MAVNKQDSKSPDILGIQRREVSPYVISEVSCWGHSDSNESGEHRDDFHRSESEEDDQEREHSRSDNRRGKPKRHSHSSEEDGDESLHSALGRAFGLHVGRPTWSVNPGYQVTYDIGTKPGYHSSSSVKYYKWSTTPSWSYTLGRQLGRQNDIGPESFQLGSVKYRRRPMIWRSNPGRQMRRYGGHESFHSGRRRN